jgi:hypothetical protein
MQRIFIAIGFLIAFTGFFLIKTEDKTPIIVNNPPIQKSDISITPTATAANETDPGLSIQTALEKMFGEKPEKVPPENLPEKVLLNVPFTSQAPFGNWADDEQDYGCEEASLLMALYWAKDEKLTSEVALKQIKGMSKFEQEKYGDYHDTSVNDTLDILKTYLNYENAYAKFDIGIEDIKAELAAGNVVIVPIDARKVYNVYYTPPGPFRHQIVIIGYNDATGEFITHDPGTAHGAGYRYSYKTMARALMDYPTGFNEPVDEVRTAMLVVTK